jgi:hypothetical protein
MMKKLLFLLVYTVLIGSIAGNAAASQDREWTFRVLLDGKEVGNQHFVLTDEGEQTRLETRAEFKVKFLFATVYRYLHRNEETWQGNCLAEIESSTDANGKPYAVNGKKREGFFELLGDGQSEKLPECISTFAYWDPSFLQNDRLLNTQNGEYLEVEVSDPEPDYRTIRGERVPALKYRLEAGELDLQLWYSADDEWLALESKTKGDRILSYELL